MRFEDARSAFADPTPFTDRREEATNAVVSFLKRNPKTDRLAARAVVHLGNVPPIASAFTERNRDRIVKDIFMQALIPENRDEAERMRRVGGFSSDYDALGASLVDWFAVADAFRLPEKVLRTEPLFERILVRLEKGKEREGSIYIPETSQEKARGVGHASMIVRLGKGEELRDGRIRPLPLLVGDRVVFNKGAANVVYPRLDGVDYAILHELDCHGVVSHEADVTRGRF